MIADNISSFDSNGTRNKISVSSAVGKNDHMMIFVPYLICIQSLYLMIKLGD